MDPARSHQRRPEPNRDRDCAAPRPAEASASAQLTTHGLSADAHGMTRETGRKKRPAPVQLVYFSKTRVEFSLFRCERGPFNY